MCSFGTKGELEGVLSEDLMEKIIDELEKAQGGGKAAFSIYQSIIMTCFHRMLCYSVSMLSYMICCITLYCPLLPSLDLDLGADLCRLCYVCVLAMELMSSLTAEAALAQSRLNLQAVGSNRQVGDTHRHAIPIEGGGVGQGGLCGKLLALICRADPSVCMSVSVLAMSL